MKAQKGYAIAAALPRTKTTATGSLLSRLWKQVKRWNELAAQRRLLASMPDATLKDLGLSRADLEQEAERPFWDDPLRR
ncbi:DUF1127 domain-containing protein [Pseudomonas sp. GV071]|uniref:DUF1127 domain-containing protein n=1 Tax=Pseudomonas sp. GV071 TaxID=2135754 RepID=UPI000D33D811|nr:DUF1127 domain-containing protein [Pseudomonas sp. GV071]PTQ74062.1 uncharacterized protein YjiS (DUF1127 family) [Pseudomonas sp. GV071]